jgi:hypothetical protein
MERSAIHLLCKCGKSLRDRCRTGVYFGGKRTLKWAFDITEIRNWAIARQPSPAR